MIKDFSAALLRELHKARTLRADAVLAGKPKDWAEYQKLCGEIRGLDLAETEITALAKKVEKHDNDD